MEKKNSMYETFLRRFFLTAAVLLLAAAGLVFVFDPFFHYHEPLGPLKAVLTKKEYQVPGTLQNFSYDSVIAGSSTAENFNNRWFDEAFDTQSVKAIKSSGVTAQLDYYIRMAARERELDYVFYSLDLFALSGDPDTEFPDESMPLYLYDENPFTDIKYLLNGDVIFEDIPYLLAETFLDDYDEGASYNWAQYHSFSREDALANYGRPREILQEKTPEEYRPFIDGNVDLLEQLVRDYPDTVFCFFYPPYSLLWWDNMIRSGQLEQSLYAAEASMERLLSYDNVRIYYFQNEEDVILDLDLYMDPIHFSEDINHWMVEEMAQDHYRVTGENYASGLEKMARIAERIRTDYDVLTAVQTDG